MAVDWVWRSRDRETWEELRARMIAETSAYISECLRHPEYAVTIPVALAGTVEFPPSFCAAFWGPVLFD